MTKIYALYKGEKELAYGTVAQIAYKMGVKVDTIRFLLSPAYKKRCKCSTKRRELILIDEI